MLRHIFLLIGGFATLYASAATVECTAGQAETLLGASLADTSLKLTGTADATDLLYIGSKMNALTALDLSGLKIVASNTAKGNFAAATIPAGAFAGTAITTLSLPEGVIVGDCAFAGTKISTLVLPANATIGTAAFSACTGLGSVTLGASNTLGDHAFASCTALKTVNLNSTTAIGDYAFSGCAALDKVEGTSALTTIGADAFNGCENLTSFAFAPALKTIGDGAFRHSGIEKADLRNTSVVTIGQWAFADCSSLTSVVMPQSCTTLGTGVFFDCPDLSEINISGSITTIPAYAFKDDSSIHELTLDHNLKVLGDYSLKGTGVTSLTLPAQLDSIGSNAMEDMKDLGIIDASNLEAVPALGDDVWNGVVQSDVTLQVHTDYAKDFENAPQWQDFTIQPVGEVSVITTPSDQEVAVRGAFTAAHLLIESTVPVQEFSVYDLAGSLLLRQAPDSCSIAVSADNFGNMIIVNCLLADGSTATLKLAR